MLFPTCLHGFFIQITVNNCIYIAFLEQIWVDFIYLKTHFVGNAPIDPILIYVIDNAIRSRLIDIRQIPGNGSYLVFAPRASI